MKGIVLLLFLLFAYEVRAQEGFKLPANPRGLVVDYLANLKVKDTSRRLDEREKHELCRLFVKAYVVSIRQHHQDYSISPSTAVYRLLVTNFPDVVARESENGSVIFLGAITKFFNSLPEYRGDVYEVLREDIDPRHCKQ